MNAGPPVPRYVRALAALRADVTGGLFPKRLPTEVELAVRYDVSRMTLRRAIGALVEEGLLEGRRGAGTFLRENSGSNHTIAMVMVPDLAINHHDPYHQQLLASLVRCCTKRNWTLRVAPNIEDLTVRLTAGRSLAVAACVAVAFGPDHCAALAGLPVPVVVVDGEPLPGRPAILPDNKGGIKTALTRLIELGHREIVHCAGSLHQPSGRERKQAFVVGSAKAGLSLRDGSVHQGHFLIEDGYEAMARWHTAPVRPTAVICANDMMAVGALRWLAEHGMVAGRDISLVGFDGLFMTELTWPQLATMALDYNAHLDAAIECILDPARTGVKRTPHTLIERASLGPPRR